MGFYSNLFKHNKLFFKANSASCPGSGFFDRLHLPVLFPGFFF
jgi:hypothetical protein